MAKLDEDSRLKSDMTSGFVSDDLNVDSLKLSKLSNSSLSDQSDHDQEKGPKTKKSAPVTEDRPVFPEQQQVL